MFRTSLLTIVLATGFVTPTAIAQCAAIPGTGCAGAPPLVCLGAPQINQLAQVAYVAPGAADLVLTGVNLDGTLFALPPGLGCAAGCVMAGVPVASNFGIGAAQYVFLVPNDVSLVGLNIYAQALYAPAGLGYSCWIASNALVGTVIP